MVIPLILPAMWVGQQIEVKKGPDRTDFLFAQADHVRDMMGGTGMVHCNRFRDYRVSSTAEPMVYKVRYVEYRARGPWKRLNAVVRRDGDRWSWVQGDPPKCSITIFETEEK